MVEMISPAHEFQGEIGEANITIVISVLFFCIIASTFFIAVSFASSNNLRPEIEDSVTGGERESSNTSVGVSAEVRNTLGTMHVSENEMEKTMLVFGNYEGGFSVTDCRLLKVIYHQSTMPGDGVIIKVPKSVQNACTMSYY